MASILASQGSIPHYYDQYLAPLFFEPYAVDLVNRNSSLKVKRVLELACGTGRLTRHLLQLVDLSGLLYATDLNEDMLDIAKRQLKDPRIFWQQLNAQELPYEDQMFDLVVCQFGVMFFPDKQKAFREALRVLKPGSKFVFLTWDNVIYNTVSRHTQFILQNVFPEDPPYFSKKGPYSYFDKSLIISNLQEAGFQHIEIASVALTGKSEHVDEVVLGIIEGSLLAAYLEGRGANKALIKEQMQQALSNTIYKSGNTFHYPMQALYCTGVR